LFVLSLKIAFFCLFFHATPCNNHATPRNKRHATQTYMKHFCERQDLQRVFELMSAVAAGENELIWTMLNQVGVGGGGTCTCTHTRTPGVYLGSVILSFFFVSLRFSRTPPLETIVFSPSRRHLFRFPIGK
jgi:hypothetical protein